MDGKGEGGYDFLFSSRHPDWMTWLGGWLGAGVVPHNSFFFVLLICFEGKKRQGFTAHLWSLLPAPNPEGACPLAAVAPHPLPLPVPGPPPPPLPLAHPLPVSPPPLPHSPPRFHPPPWLLLLLLLLLPCVSSDAWPPLQPSSSPCAPPQRAHVVSVSTT